MVYCGDHADKDAMAYWIKKLAEKIEELGGEV
jgi:hypothetical protein